MPLKTILLKEAKTLLRDRYIIFSVILAPFLSLLVIGTILGIVFQEMSRQVEEATGGGLPGGSKICLEDPGDELARKLAEYLKAPLADCDDRDYRVLIVVHKGFGDALRSGSPGFVTIRVATENPLSLVAAFITESVSYEVMLATSQIIAEMYGVNATLLTRPVVVASEIEVQGRRLTAETQPVAIGLATGVVVAVLALATTSLQVGALSVGVEREARTIESLLVLPLARWHVVVGKAGSVVIVSSLSIISLTMGLAVYLYGVSRVFQAPAQGEAVSLRDVIEAGLEQMGIGPLDMLAALAGFSLAVAISSLLGVALGVMFAGDVRGALTTGSYAGIVMVAPLIPTVLGYEPGLPVEALFALSPLYPPARAAMLSLSGSVADAAPYFAISAAYLALAAAIATLAFRPSPVLRGARGLVEELLALATRRSPSL